LFFEHLPFSPPPLKLFSSASFQFACPSLKKEHRFLFFRLFSEAATILTPAFGFHGTCFPSFFCSTSPSPSRFFPTKGKQRLSFASHEQPHLRFSEGRMLLFPPPFKEISFFFYRSRLFLHGLFFFFLVLFFFFSLLRVNLLWPLLCIFRRFAQSAFHGKDPLPSPFLGISIWHSPFSLVRMVFCFHFFRSFSLSRMELFFQLIQIIGLHSPPIISLLNGSPPPLFPGIIIIDLMRLSLLLFLRDGPNLFLHESVCFS